jgi:hypothetical protein
MIPVLLLAVVAAPVAAPDPPPRALHASLVTTSAIGLTHGRFFNQMLGGRIEHRFTPKFAFGMALSYANLEGKDRRVHNVLPEVTTLYRAVLDGARVGVPLRLSMGYLPRNGPTLRLGLGLDLALSDRVSLELYPLEPMIWVTRERPELSLDGSLALEFVF